MVVKTRSQTKKETIVARNSSTTERQRTREEMLVATSLLALHDMDDPPCTEFSIRSIDPAKPGCASFSSTQKLLTNKGEYINVNLKPRIRNREDCIIL